MTYSATMNKQRRNSGIYASDLAAIPAAGGRVSL